MNMHYTYLEDIEIARKEIAEMKLFPEEAILCDLYALPSHNFQTYYAMIYEHAGHLEMVYARTELYASTDPYNEPILMYSFSSNKEAGKHPELDGRIIAGMKRIPGEMELLLTDIMENIPDEKHIEDSAIIDGVLQAIRVFEGDNVVKEVAYRDAERIPLKGHSEYLADELSSLYIKIGDLIRS